jgi:2-hydroxychromene-2-carboxylate isomerase
VIYEELSVETVRFWFDPSCYWSWRAARWLMDAAQQRDLNIDWRPFSLTLLYGAEMNPDWRPMLETSHQALRLIQALREAGRLTEAEAFYLALGRAVHEEGQEMSDSTVQEAAKAAGVTDLTSALTDQAIDGALQASFAQAMAAAGPDIGSPVMQIPGAERGIYGPVLAEVPPADQAGELWDSVARLTRSPLFFELKRGRP